MFGIDLPEMLRRKKAPEIPPEQRAELQQECTLANHFRDLATREGWKIFVEAMRQQYLETEADLANPMHTKTLEELRELQGRLRSLKWVLNFVPSSISNGDQARERLNGASDE